MISNARSTIKRPEAPPIPLSPCCTDVPETKNLKTQPNQVFSPSALLGGLGLIKETFMSPPTGIFALLAIPFPEETI
jgi:hypothetical protein